MAWFIWEYRFVDLIGQPGALSRGDRDVEQNQQWLNELGADGWDLVAVVQSRPAIILKRSKFVPEDQVIDG
jgi:hypothetical protein